MSWLAAGPEGVVLTVRVTPRSSRSRIDGPRGDALKIRLDAPPVDGRANEALLEFLSDQLHVPRRDVVLLSGATGRTKRVLIRGLDAARAAGLLST